MEEQLQKNQNADQAENYGDTLFEWDFPEFDQPTRSRSWYFWGGVVAGIFLLYAVWNGNVLFGLIVLIASGIILMFRRSRNEMKFKITEDGIFINQRFFPYTILDHFFIIYNPPHVKTLYFEPRSYLNPRIPVPLQDQNPVAIRETLLLYLKENLDREDEPFTDQIGKIFKL